MTSVPAVYPELSTARLSGRPLHLAIGMFDGVHRGHRAVLEAARDAAQRDGGEPAVLTFSPHPSRLFRPEQPTLLLQDLAAKRLALEALGFPVMLVQPFTAEFAQVVAEEFLKWLKGLQPQLAAVYVGENFRFGRGRRGDVGTLRSTAGALGITVFSAPRVNLQGEAISSTRIRQLIEDGGMAEANELLGYAYFSTGKVAGGKRLGRTIGFPTLNLSWTPECRPRFGVYAVRVRRERGGEFFPAVANYGLRPTVESTAEPRLEAHVLGECPFREGDELFVEWLKFLRPETRFGSVGALREQIGRDREHARAYFGRPA